MVWTSRRYWLIKFSVARTRAPALCFRAHTAHRGVRVRLGVNGAAAATATAATTAAAAG